MKKNTPKTSDDLMYQSGFGNVFSSEALKGALPVSQNSPQKVPLGLYAELLSGTAFTLPRKDSQWSWLYRRQPSVVHGDFKPYSDAKSFIAEALLSPNPNQLRWSPRPAPSQKVDFIDSIFAMARNGNAHTHAGCSVYLYSATASMEDRFLSNADGDFLIVPQSGSLLFQTEFGNLKASPGEIVVIPRGIKYQVTLLEKNATGYICENYGLSLRLPDLGPIGTTGLANSRHFLAPVAKFEEKRGNFELVTKFQESLWSASIDHSPLDVVAWYGNYYPYKYDLHLFNTINTVSFDHMDPSIFTVLTSPSGDQPGLANLDFVIFPERWMVAEHTFRPPYFHRNFMSEYMGIVYGKYDAKEEGFLPGGSSIHNSMMPHGPDSESYEKAVHAELKPERLSNTLAFMFESRYVFRPTEQALKAQFFQKKYRECWQQLRVNS